MCIRGDVAIFVSPFPPPLSRFLVGLVCRGVVVCVTAGGGGGVAPLPRAEAIHPSSKATRTPWTNPPPRMVRAGGVRFGTGGVARFKTSSPPLSYEKIYSWMWWGYHHGRHRRTTIPQGRLPWASPWRIRCNHQSVLPNVLSGIPKRTMYRVPLPRRLPQERRKGGQAGLRVCPPSRVGRLTRGNVLPHRLLGQAHPSRIGCWMRWRTCTTFFVLFLLRFPRGHHPCAPSRTRRQGNRRSLRGPLWRTAFDTCEMVMRVGHYHGGDGWRPSRRNTPIKCSAPCIRYTGGGGMRKRRGAHTMVPCPTRLLSHRVLPWPPLLRFVRHFRRRRWPCTRHLRHCCKTRYRKIYFFCAYYFSFR